MRRREPRPAAHLPRLDRRERDREGVGVGSHPFGTRTSFQIPTFAPSPPTTEHTVPLSPTRSPLLPPFFRSAGVPLEPFCRPFAVSVAEKCKPREPKRNRSHPSNPPHTRSCTLRSSALRRGWASVSVLGGGGGHPPTRLLFCCLCVASSVSHDPSHRPTFWYQPCLAPLPRRIANATTMKMRLLLRTTALQSASMRWRSAAVHYLAFVAFLLPFL